MEIKKLNLQAQENNINVVANRRALTEDVEPNSIEEQYGDPLTATLIQPYIINGLEITTADPNVITRDQNGNIVLFESTEEDEIINQNLVIEPNSERYTNRSFLDTVDTRFKFYRFPPKITVTSRTTEQQLSADALRELEQIDIIRALYKPLYTDIYRVPNPFAKLAFNEVVDGILQREPGTYLITPEIIATGKDIRMTGLFRVFNNTTTEENFGARFWRKTLNPRGGDFASIIARTLNTKNSDGTNIPDNQIQRTEDVPAGRYQDITIQYLIKNSEMQPYDKWEFQGQAGGNTLYLESSYWLIEPVTPNTLTQVATIQATPVQLNTSQTRSGR